MTDPSIVRERLLSAHRPVLRRALACADAAAGGLASGDIGNVCTELVEAYEDGWEPVDCHFWAFTTGGAGEFLGEWEVHEGWFHALDRGDISETDFSTLVLSTRRPADEAFAGAES